MAGAKKARAKKATREIRRTKFKGQRLGKRWVSVVQDILAKDGIKLARQILAQQKSKELAFQDFTGEIVVRMPVVFLSAFGEGAVLYLWMETAAWIAYALIPRRVFAFVLALVRLRVAMAPR